MGRLGLGEEGIFMVGRFMVGGGEAGIQQDLINPKATISFSPPRVTLPPGFFMVETRSCKRILGPPGQENLMKTHR